MKYALALVFILSTSYFVLRETSDNSIVQNCNEDITKTTQSILENADADYSQLFLMLLANLGIKNELANRLKVITNTDLEGLKKEINYLKTENEDLKSKTPLCPKASDQREVNINKQSLRDIKPEPIEEFTNEFDFVEVEKTFEKFLPTKDFKSIIKNSYIAAAPIKFFNTNLIFNVLQRGRGIIDRVEIETKMQHNGRYNEGKINIFLYDKNRIVSKIEESGPNKNALYIDAERKYIAFQVESFYLVFTLNKNMSLRNNKSGRLYQIIDGHTDYIGRLVLR